MSSHVNLDLAATLLPLALAVVTFGIGLSLTVGDFRRVRTLPMAVAAGLAGQFLLLPVLAVGVALLFTRVFGLAPELALGLLLLAAVPGGTVSNLAAYLSRADAALSVTLTTFSNLASALVTPTVFLLGARLVAGRSALVEVSFLSVAATVLAIVVVPVVIGMAVHHRWPRAAARSDRAFRIASAVVFAAVVVGVIAQNRERFVELAVRSVPAALVLNVLALAGGALLARAARLPDPQRRTVILEVGLQNAVLAITLAVTQLRSAEVALVPGFYGLVMLVTAGGLAWWWGRTSHPVAAEQPPPLAAMPPRR